MSTVKIKTEPTAATATAATVDVQVKLEPSLATVDIKLEQHTSDIDTKIEEDDFKSESDSDDSDEDTDQNQFTITPRTMHKFRCDHPGCTRSSTYSSHIRMHRFDHMLEADINMKGKILILTRESVDDQWPCPIPDCERLFRTAGAACTHVRSRHSDILKQQKLPSQITWHKLYFIDVDHFYVNDVRCGYYTTIGVFICHDCRLVPECLLTHLQEKHGYDEKSVDNFVLPDSAVNANADPSINQHTSNPHLAAAIKQPYQQHHQDIAQGWLCVTSDCGHCGHTAHYKKDHKKRIHQGEQISTVPALVLRLAFSKSNSSYFFITRLDQASGSVTINRNRVNRRRLDLSHNGLNTQDESGGDVDQNETTNAPNQKRQYICDHDGCERSFNSATKLSMHRREHKCEVATAVYGEAFTLTRQSSDDRWPCPVPDCERTCKAIEAIRVHIRSAHLTSAKQKRVKSEDDDSCQQQQPVIKRRQCTRLYIKVDDFYISGTKCGYHTTTGLFICHECKVVPECLLTHLQQNHGFDEKSIDSAFLPESARITGSDPNRNQHTTNPHLAAAIREPSKPHHQDIVHGWLCIAPNCGYCHFTKKCIENHQRSEHRGKQLSTFPALVLRLLFAKIQTSSFLITRLDTMTTNSIESGSSTGQYNSECDDEEGDGDELVLSDYSDDEDDIH